MDLNLSSNYYSILKQLQAVDFVLIDLTLYLDTHPNDTEAIRQLNHYYLERKKLVDFYERNYGPLSTFGHSPSGTPWDWIDIPWPWQI